MAGTSTGDDRTVDDRTADGQPSLKRVMGPGLLLLFIVGDVLGTGIYALTGTVAAEVGGVVWLPFLIAFLVALVTAFSYLELVTKYPQAAGAALYAHKAFGVHFVTFLVAFAVMSSGITSASTAARAFSARKRMRSLGWRAAKFSSRSIPSSPPKCAESASSGSISTRFMMPSIRLPLVSNRYWSRKRWLRLLPRMLIETDIASAGSWLWTSRCAR